MEVGVEWVVEYVHLSGGSGYDAGTVGEGLRGGLDEGEEEVCLGGGGEWM